MKATIDIHEMEAFVTVVRAKSFTAAADIMDSNKAHISRVVSRLETKLSTQLLKRSTRSLHMTEEGKELFERATGILAAIEETQASISRNQSEPSGHLRITAGSEFGTIRVNHWVSKYLQLYGGVNVETEFTNRLVDIIHEGFDVAIRVGTLPDSELSARKLGEIHYGIYASSKYLKEYGKPETPHDLNDHVLIMFSNNKSHWRLANKTSTVDVAAKPKIVTNNNIAAAQLAADGIGITLVPKLVAEEPNFSGRLVRVLPDWYQIPIPVHALFTSSRYMTPKVRAFIDLAIREFS